MSALGAAIVLALFALAARAEPVARTRDAFATVRPALSVAKPSDVRGRLDVVPAECEIGEPVVWVLALDHEKDVVVRATTPELGLDWILLEDQRVVRTLDGAAGKARTEITWRVASLDAGERTLPPITVEIEENGTKRTLFTGAAGAPAASGDAAAASTATSDVAAAEPATSDAAAVGSATPDAAAGGPAAIESANLVVRSALAPDEDAPRPQRGFLPPPPGAAGRRLWPWIAGALALVAIFVVVRSRKRRKSAPIAAPTPLESLAILERRLADDPDAGRVLVYDASRLLRDAVDAALGETRAASTDADWVRAIEADERLPLGVRTASARILASAERTKYALEVPTRFALAELFGDVHHVLEALAEARIEPSAETTRERRGAAA